MRGTNRWEQERENGGVELYGKLGAFAAPSLIMSSKVTETSQRAVAEIDAYMATAVFVVKAHVVKREKEQTRCRRPSFR